MFQSTLLDNYKRKPNHTFNGNSQESLAIIYLTFAFANWFTPIILTWIRPKYSMFLSSIIFALFMASFIEPMDWSLYLGSFLVGVATAVMWTSSGNFLSLNSNTKTIRRNTTIFWSLFQSSLIFGNLFQYHLYKDFGDYDPKSRKKLYSVFAGCCLFAGLLLLMLQQPVDITELNIATSDGDLYVIPSDYNMQQYSTNYTPFEAFFQSFLLLPTVSMLLLLIVFAYTGFVLTFIYGVFGTFVGHMEQLRKPAKGYFGLIGIAIGAGEVTSILLLTGISRLWKQITPEILVIIGLAVHIVCFYLIFLSIPLPATIGQLVGPTYIEPRGSIFIFCGYLLGSGDGLFNTQIISLLAGTYKGIDSPSAFALFKFLQSLASAVGFLSIRKMQLHWQLLILCIMGVLGTVAFICVEDKTRKIILARDRDLSLTIDSMDE